MTIALNVSPALAIASRDDLKNYIASEVDRDLTETDAMGTLSAKLDTWILLAEARFNRDFRTSDMERTITFLATSANVPLPSDYISMLAIYENGNPDQPLMATSPSQVRQSYDGTPGQPVAYTLVAQEIRLLPPPDTNYLLTMDYYGSIAGLSQLNNSNWVLEKHPDVYVAAVLFNFYRWASDMDKASAADAYCQQLIENINEQARMDRYGAGPLARATISQTRFGRC